MHAQTEKPEVQTLQGLIPSTRTFDFFIRQVLQATRFLRFGVELVELCCAAGLRRIS